jgi:hypothetical protein
VFKTLFGGVVRAEHDAAGVTTLEEKKVEGRRWYAVLLRICFQCDILLLLFDASSSYFF